MVFPCNMLAFDGKFAGLPRGPIDVGMTPGGIGDWDDVCPDNEANEGNPGDLCPSLVKLLEEVGVGGLPSLLFIALDARSKELRNIEDCRLEFSEKIFEVGVPDIGGASVMVSRPELLWLEWKGIESWE